MAKILVVDDSLTFRSQVKSVLVGVGHEVLEASSGDEGLKVINKVVNLDLVITDLNMPGGDGLAMLNDMKKTEGPNRDVPVFVMTTQTTSALKDEGRRVGVKAWIVKPLKPEKLLEAIDKVLGTKK